MKVVGEKLFTFIFTIQVGGEYRPGQHSYADALPAFERRLHELGGARGAASPKAAPLANTASALDAILNDSPEPTVEDAALGPATEAALLAALQALGVLRFPSAQVCVCERERATV